MHLPAPVETAMSLLQEAGYSAYIVGGCVRDSLLGKTPFDYDLTTSALPMQIEVVFSDFTIVETGLKHGTVTVIIDGMPLEITTFRKEGTYSDGRHPDAVFFTDDIREDLKRRDFTINAIAYSKQEGIVDCFGGQKDLEKGIIRAVGNADLRFKEDALRIMRGLRFASCLGFSIEEETSKAIINNRQLLAHISVERIREELFKMLCGENIKEILMTYPQVMVQVIPELSSLIGFDQHNPHHIYDIFMHTSVAVENTPALPHLRLSALLHDIGKSKTFTMDKKGIGHFYGHGKVGYEMSKEILTRLKVDNATKARVLSLIGYHDDNIPCNQKAVKGALNKMGEELFFDLLELKRADNKAQNIACFNHLAEYDALENIAKSIISEGQCFCLKDLALCGDDLLALGFKGKKIGDAFKFLLDAVIDERVENSKEELIEFLKKKYK